MAIEATYNNRVCKLQHIQHRDKSESLICKTILDDERKATFTVKMTLLPKPDCNGHEWLIKGECCETHDYADNRVGTAVQFIRWAIDLCNSAIEANKYVETTVRVPKGTYCNSPLECPLFDSGGGFEYQCACRYLSVDLEYARDERIVKHKDCPARQRDLGKNG